ncbi:hypothetical protein [Streptomyces sp. WMMC897]|uniref:hypothetical protein n=1 Tax=Streptomyces sp. WMMC897 TaxID=3014782 RepID=UPI0022B6281D|nr:hypothetical protein [Streptomyces sp. WMMC897]MCZ7417047.1 hypothetical protein [Streptomyces sp. WMMC897]
MAQLQLRGRFLHVRNQHKKSALAAAAVLLAVTGLSACGSEGNGLAEKSGKEVVDEAGKALKDAKSVRMKMDTSEEGAFSIDLAMDNEGNCAGVIDQGEQGKVELVKQGEKVWMKPDQKFWETQAGGPDGAATWELVKGKYLSGTTEDPMMSGMAGTCDLKAIQEDIGSDDEDAKWSDPKEGEVEGQSVVTVESTKDDEKTTLHVAAEGTAYPVQSIGDESGTQSKVTFSEWDKPVADEVPSEEESLDMAKLQQMG